MGKDIDLPRGPPGAGLGACPRPPADHLRPQTALSAHSVCCVNITIIHVLGDIKFGKHWGAESEDGRRERREREQCSVTM